RMHQIELFMRYPYEVQQEWLYRLLATAKDTEWGQKYDYASIRTEAEFKKRVPISEYEDVRPFIDRLRKGEQDILWPGEIRWFAKSSGTTGGKSKFIPVSQESLDECHFKGGKDMLTLYCNNNPEALLFDGKTLSLGGSHKGEEGNMFVRNGDLSAILMENLPQWAEFFRAPDLSIALMSEWEEKMDKIAQAIVNENITGLSGVPSWMLVLLRHTLTLSGKKNLADVWPNMEVFFHGGVNFTPYREQFTEMFKPLKINFWEVYNASEGFFGIQDNFGGNDLLLMLDYGIYYEFIPMENIEKRNVALSLREVQTGVNYALIISTSGGLWRYMLGDTIQFTSINPFRFIITGRVKYFINAFGEELIMDNAEKALSAACERTGAIVAEYTVAPVYMQGNAKGAHEWLIEFESAPENINYFTEALDNALKSQNSDYEAKRYKDMTLTLPVIRSLPKGTFFNWLKLKGKLGGQNKVPRLANDRKIVDDILAHVKQHA
ncbi:MAG TPA: GH3 auxin-responsive promoter family protein, partial [Bacteroidia bacterium]|nr:GH3 auxin-responsive promoter family protein [Bacteroidia bacterium]